MYTPTQTPTKPASAPARIQPTLSRLAARNTMLGCSGFIGKSSHGGVLSKKYQREKKTPTRGEAIKTGFREFLASTVASIATTTTKPLPLKPLVINASTRPTVQERVFGSEEKTRASHRQGSEQYVAPFPGPYLVPDSRFPLPATTAIKKSGVRGGEIEFTSYTGSARRGTRAMPATENIIGSRGGVTRIPLVADLQTNPKVRITSPAVHHSNLRQAWADTLHNRGCHRPHAAFRHDTDQLGSNRLDGRSATPAAHVAPLSVVAVAASQPLLRSAA